jgi:hypothetical protein
VSYDPKAILEEVRWLKANPHFDQRPATIEEFLGPGYLDIYDKVRPGLRDALKEIFGDKVQSKRIAKYERAMFTGAIGIGKTTFASIALPYMVHWVLCLRDPQDYYELLPGSRIAFMQMSTSERQASDVVFGDIKARIEHSPWFVNNYPFNPKFSKQLKFPKDIWILPGDSAETTFEGYNILAGILDEMDSHKVTEDKDYAELGYDTIHSRIASRFIDEKSSGHKGLLMAIGQMKKAQGFAAKKYKEMKTDPKSLVVRMAIWESLGWHRFLLPDGSRDSFWYDARRKSVVPDSVASVITNENMIEIPNAYAANFRNNPEKALRDLAGIPPQAADPFISLVDRVDEARDKWIARNGPDSPVKDNPTRPLLEDWFTATNDPRRRAVHVDLAYSADGDALGFSMGHIEEMVEIEGERKPYIVFDCLIRMKALPGTEILLSEVRQLIYHLKDDRGFRITHVSYDGFESTDTIQQLRKKHYFADKISVDKSTLPYEDLREAIYERRLEFPPYMTYINKNSSERVEIAVQELLALTDTGKKIDHPVNGSKDVADSMAGVCYALIGNRDFRKGVTSIRNRQLGDKKQTLAEMFSAPAEDYSTGLAGSIPPMAGAGVPQLIVPDRLRAKP